MNRLCVSAWPTSPRDLFVFKMIGLQSDSPDKYNHSSTSGCFARGRLICYGQSGGFGSEQTENCLHDYCLFGFDIELFVLVRKFSPPLAALV